MDKWTEMRSAYLVAKLGTISAAADALGVHRATVNRHIETLEKILETKLFQRHARGYTPTDAGRDLLETAGRVEEMFAELAGRNHGRNSQFSGDLILTCLSGFVPLIMPAISQFRTAYPKVTLHVMAENRLACLEYGEAHVALRAGPKPEEADYVVQPFHQLRFALYAHKSYLQQYGKPADFKDIEGHCFIGSVREGVQGPFNKWMQEHIPASAIGLNAEQPDVIKEGVLAGLGVGFMNSSIADQYEEVVEVFPYQEEWSSVIWIVTHVDLHRTGKVQEFIRFLKASALP